MKILSCFLKKRNLFLVLFLGPVLRLPYDSLAFKCLNGYEEFKNGQPVMETDEKSRVDCSDPGACCIKLWGSAKNGQAASKCDKNSILFDCLKRKRGTVSGDCLTAPFNDVSKWELECRSSGSSIYFVVLESKTALCKCSTDLCNICDDHKDKLIPWES